VESMIVQPALPRFVRPGDRFLAGAVGSIVEGEGGPGRAEARFEGVELEGEGKLDLSWLPNRPHRLNFPVRVPTPPFDAEGRLAWEEVIFRIGVERLSDGAGDAFEVKLPLRDDRDRVRLRLLADLDPDEPLALPDVEEEVRPGSLKRTVLISDQPALVRMASALRFLLDYPYGCTEQRLSRARAQLALRGFRDLLYQEGDDEALDRAVNQTIEWIAQMVRPNGLVAYWPGSSGYVSITAWVVEFLVEAREAGYPVDDDLFNTLTRALEQALRSDYSEFIDGEKWAERTWALQALASAGQFNAGYGAELARKSQYLDLEHVAVVLMAFDRAEERSSPVVGPLTDELWDGLVIRLHQGREIYGGLQVRRQTRNGLILPSETRTRDPASPGAHEPVRAARPGACDQARPADPRAARRRRRPDAGRIRDGPASDRALRDPAARTSPGGGHARGAPLRGAPHRSRAAADARVRPDRRHHPRSRPPARSLVAGLGRGAAPGAPGRRQCRGAAQKNVPQKNVPAPKKCACPKKMCLTFCKSPQLAGRRSAGHRGGRPRAARNAVADTAAARSPRPLPRRIGRGRRRGFRLLARRLAAAAAGGGDAGSRTGAFARIPESTPKRSSMPSSRMSAADVGSPGPRPSPCRSRACSIPVRAPTRAKRSKP